MMHGICNATQWCQPHRCHLRWAGAKFVNGTQLCVDQLKCVHLLWIVHQLNCPAIQEAHFTRFTFEVVSWCAENEGKKILDLFWRAIRICLDLPFERFRCKIEQWIGIQLQPVALPRSNGRFSAIFEYSFASNASFHHCIVRVKRWVIVLYDVIAVRFEIGNWCNACTARTASDAIVAINAITTFRR